MEFIWPDQPKGVYLPVFHGVKDPDRERKLARRKKRNPSSVEKTQQVQPLKISTIAIAAEVLPSDASLDSPTKKRQMVTEDSPYVISSKTSLTALSRFEFMDETKLHEPPTKKRRTDTEYQPLAMFSPDIFLDQTNLPPSPRKKLTAEQIEQLTLLAAQSLVLLHPVADEMD